MQVTYQGIFDSVLAPEVRLEPIKRGEKVEVDDELARRLLCQEVNWTASKADRERLAREDEARKVAETPAASPAAPSEGGPDTPA